MHPANTWCLLGTLTAAMNGSIFSFKFRSQNAYAVPSVPEFVTGTLVFTTSNGTNFQALAEDIIRSSTATWTPGPTLGGQLLRGPQAW